MSGLLLEIVLSVCICWFHNMVIIIIIIIIIIISVFKSRKMRWVGNVVPYGRGTVHRGF